MNLFTTEDGSHSIKIPELNVSYHSKHGAIGESEHIYIGAGLNFVSGKKKKISILEVGFGTGLNALLTLIKSNEDDLEIIYESVELHPLDDVFVSSLNYLSLLNAEHLKKEFQEMHSAAWDIKIHISDHFNFKKICGDIRGVQLDSCYDLVYFDAFDPVAQPELWTVKVFEKIHALMSENAVLVTFCSKGEVRRAMAQACFNIEKLRGPKGKREMVRATKM
jgi:tRNA U34 5-methylaminomethyl-2-thiouridine-forming methyltransferase MnmC